MGYSELLFSANGPRDGRGGSLVETPNFLGGLARVHADDPRLIVGAFLACE